MIDTKDYRNKTCECDRVCTCFAQLAADVETLCDHIDAQDAELVLKEKQLNGNAAILDAAAKRIEKLEAGIKRALADEESGTGWGPDVTVCEYLREALRGGE